MATQFGLPTKDFDTNGCTETQAARCKNSRCTNFELPEIFRSLIWYDSGSNDHIMSVYEDKTDLYRKPV